MRGCQIIAAFAFVLTVTSFAAAQNFDNLKIFTEEYPPYNYMEGGKVSGIATEVVVEILDRLGSKLGREDIQLVPWARAYSEVLNSRNAVIYSIVRSKERENLFKWVCPVDCCTIGVIARKREHVVIKKPEDFEKYRIGVVREDIGHQMMKKLVEEKDLDIANSSESNLRKLKEGRIDLFVYDVRVIDHILSRLELDPEMYEIVYEIDSLSLCIAFNKDADDTLVQAFQEALDQILKEKPMGMCE